MKAALLISHGSHSSELKQEIVDLIAKMQIQINIPIFEYAFLEIERPTIQEGIDSCVKKGANDIMILLNFLNSGKHVDEDIPRIVQNAKRKYPHVKFTLSRPIGQHDHIADLFADLLKKSI